MRPHRLIMKAFGPFAAETVVDFDAMGDHIYLISGDTGAGKTTIFDGIIYALYGTASGGGRSGLSTEAFHSDYAKQGKHREEMRVEFTFSNAGRTFIVERHMYWGVKGEAQKAVKESFLFENGSMVVSGKGKEDKDDVTARITELLGLDADQFRRIIMLAQGEFQKFLESGSDKRGEILGKLYDNRRHQDFELRLKAANELLKKQELALTESAKAQLGIFRLPEDASDDDLQALSIGHPDLLPVMGKLLGQMRETEASLEAKIKEKTGLKTKLLERKTQGETQNSLLDELDKKRRQLAGMEGEKPRMEALRRLVSLASSAEKIMPAEQAKRKAETDWKAVLKRIGDLEEGRIRLASEEKELRSRLEAVKKENTPQVEAFLSKKSSMENILHFYDDLDSSIQDYTVKKKRLDAASEAAAEAQKNLAQKLDRQRELAGQLKRLENAGDLAVSNADRRKEDLAEKKKKLEGLQKEVYAVQKLLGEEQELSMALYEARQAALEAEGEHFRLNAAFVQGQAGLFAEEMRKQLREPHRASVRCPVCGAEHTAADLDGFAEYHADVPTQEAVEEAMKAWNTAKNAESEAEGKYKEKAAECRTRKEALLKTAEELAGISGWDALLDGSILKEKITLCKEQLKTAQEAYKRELADRAAKIETAAQKEAADAEAAKAEQDAADAIQKENMAKTEANSAGTSVENWKKQLVGYPDTKEKAQEEIAFFERKIQDLQGQIDNAQSLHDKCLRDQAETEGNLSGALLEKASRKKEKEAAAAAFEEGLQKGGFTDEGAYRMALSPEGELLEQEGISAWILQKQQELDEYDRQRSELSAAAKQLEESICGAARVDIQELEEKISKLGEELDGLTKEEHSLRTQIQTDQEVYGQLMDIQAEKEKYRSAYLKLGPLAEAANGRYLFSRYVLSDFFHRIIEQANLHLETMTDGEYCLVPKETGDGRKNMGLDLKVLNTITGIERDTASLSGGQSFEASLALALGLSDVVQMESGSSIQIDSMFIDEGFGSLDSGRIDKALEVLQHLSGKRRQIGIISHVARLDECLPRKIHVIAGEKGSTVKIETDV